MALVILSSDKTLLLVFSGDKKAWPIYLTIGNISKDVRRRVPEHATILIGYLPVSKLECFQKKTWSVTGYCLFHYVMSLLLCPLVNAGQQGKTMVCTDGFVCRVHCQNIWPLCGKLTRLITVISFDILLVLPTR